MKSFITFIKEEVEASEGQKLKHITHAEDRPLQSGAKGFEHAKAALNQAHEHMKAGEHNSHLSMKYDGSPSIVFGHHPKTGKFFVASKSAFNKNPKINHTDEDIEKNHGHAPGLVHKLKSALHHLPKVTPKHGVYQGDLMFTHDDLHHHDGKVSFTPNTIKYTAKGDEAEKIAKSKLGVVVHTQYHGDDIHSMSADPHPYTHNFKHHPDVWTKDVAHDTSKIHYPHADQEAFHRHMAAAQEIHDKHGKTMYANTEKHQGAGGHLETYINHTVRTGETPNHEGLKNHIAAKYEKEASKLKTQSNQDKKRKESAEHIEHIENHKNDYNRLLEMHHHLQKAKDVLVHNLNKHTGGLEHHIGDKKTDPEGFVVHHDGEPTKLVNRKEFSRANLLKTR